MARNILTQLQELDQQRSKLLDGAKTEAMEKAQAAVAELNELGFNYQLVERGQRRPGSVESRKGTRTLKDAPCPICGFKTTPPHDRRAHRTQEPKRSFTNNELQSRGYRKA